MEQPPPSPRRSPADAALRLAEVDGEREALRETVESQKQTIQELYEELDEERNAASSAANEAMSMILRLQHEKAEAQMESRQFHRLAEERFEHDRREIEVLEEEIEALSSELRELQERLLAGTPEMEEDRERCDERSEGTPGTSMSSSFVRVDSEIREDEIEVLEKEVVSGSFLPVAGGEREEIPVSLECSVTDDSSDRVYTIDAVHGAPADASGGESGAVQVDVSDLQRRVLALEEDREVMQRAIVNMKAEDTQVKLLREISRNLLMAMAQQTAAKLRQRQVARERSCPGSFSFLGFLKWVVSFLFFWRRKPRPIQPGLSGRSIFGSSSNKLGLFLLLEKSQLFKQIKCLPKPEGQAFPWPPG